MSARVLLISDYKLKKVFVDRSTKKTEHFPWSEETDMGPMKGWKYISPKTQKDPKTLSYQYNKRNDKINLICALAFSYYTFIQHANNQNPSKTNIAIMWQNNVPSLMARETIEANDLQPLCLIKSGKKQFLLKERKRMKTTIYLVSYIWNRTIMTSLFTLWHTICNCRNSSSESISDSLLEFVE